jgi:hypothetical protein
MKHHSASFTHFLGFLKVLIAVPIGLTLPSAAQATGLTDAFAPGNWVLHNTNIDETLASPLYPCSISGHEVACVTINDISSGSFDVIGSSEFFAGGNNEIGATTAERTTTWKLLNTGPQAQLSFKWLFSNGEDVTDIASYLISDTVSEAEVELSNVPTAFTDTISNLIIPTNGSIAFRVKTLDNIGNPAILSITDFGAVATGSPTNVPGPLPFLGCAAAFSWSRKLSKRVRQTSRTR